MKSKDNVYSLRLPSDLMEKLDKLEERSKISRASLIAQAIILYLGQKHYCLLGLAEEEEKPEALEPLEFCKAVVFFSAEKVDDVKLNTLEKSMGGSSMIVATKVGELLSQGELNPSVELNYPAIEKAVSKIKNIEILGKPYLLTAAYKKNLLKDCKEVFNLCGRKKSMVDLISKFYKEEIEK